MGKRTYNNGSYVLKQPRLNPYYVEKDSDYHPNLRHYPDYRRLQYDSVKQEFVPKIFNPIPVKSTYQEDFDLQKNENEQFKDFDTVDNAKCVKLQKFRDLDVLLKENNKNFYRKGSVVREDEEPVNITGNILDSSLVFKERCINNIGGHMDVDEDEEDEEEYIILPNDEDQDEDEDLVEEKEISLPKPRQLLYGPRSVRKILRRPPRKPVNIDERPPFKF